MTTPAPDILKEYQRPDLEPEEIQKARQLAARVLQQPLAKKIEFLHVLIMENMILTKEVNQHRAAAGYQPLKVHG